MMKNKDNVLLDVLFMLLISIAAIGTGILIGKIMADVSYVTTEDSTTTYIISCEKRE